MSDPKIPVNPNNPLDLNKDGVLDKLDLKVLAEKTIRIVADWIVWWFQNRKPSAPK